MTRDEPAITLPTARLIAVTFACCAVSAAAWVMVSMLFGFGQDVALGGVVAAGLTAVCATIGLLLTFPWIAKPVSTAMTLWMVGDVLSMGLSLGGAYMLYSAVLRVGSPHYLAYGLQPLFLGTALALFLVLLGKAIFIAGFMRKHFTDVAR